MTAFFSRTIARAVAARVFLVAEGAYLVAVGLTFVGTDRTFFGVNALSAVAAFVVAGLACWGLAWKATHHPATMSVCVAAVGLAVLCRMGGIIIDPVSDSGRQIRAFGWALQWLAVIVCTTQIMGADAMRKRVDLWGG